MRASDYRLLAILFLLASLFSCRLRTGGGGTLAVYAVEEEWDAGLISDTLRLLQHDFHIVNASHDTCQIVRIDRTCGCIRTTADRTAILPGDTAVVTMTVELDNSPYIDKEVYVYTSLLEEPVALYITAIRGVSDQRIQAHFQYPLGERLRATGPMIVPPFLERGKTFAAYTNIVNAGTEPVEVWCETVDTPDWLTAEAPSTLQPKEAGRITLSFDLTKPCKEWGKHEYRLLVGEKGKRLYPITIPAIVTPDLTSPADGHRPQAFLPKKGYVLLGSDKRKSTTTKHFDIVNMGGGTLTIADVTPSLARARCRIGKKELSEREKTRIFVDVPVSDLRHDSIMVIGITTNDRHNPYQEVEIVWEGLRF